ncbi:MAG: hypothetical protein KDA90_07145 [Planctomycetaceae bacterium]|nr:hypothetical protein [Planctomycetaceae bacterium]
MSLIRLLTLFAFVAHATFGCGTHLRLECGACSQEAGEARQATVCATHGHCGHAHHSDTASATKSTESPACPADHGDCHCGDGCQYVASRCVTLESAPVLIVWTVDTETPCVSALSGPVPVCGITPGDWSIPALARCAELQRWLI